jgi:nucleoside-diphosphate-sugar epimerase
MKLAVLGAGGGLGRNVVDAALAAGHTVVALVRDPARAGLPPEVTTVVGDATRAADVSRAMAGADAAMYCVNPPLATWLQTFRPLLEAAIEGARASGARLIFPANVWVYGPGRPGDRVDESRAVSPTSRRGELRASMEQAIRDAGIRYALIRLPEFYGPSVTTLTARPIDAALKNKRTLWPGVLDADVEFVFMPDAARAMVQLAVAPNCDAEVFHLPGAQTTPRKFIERVYAQVGAKPRATAIHGWPLALVGKFDATVGAVSDIGHLWTDPILLDGSKYRARFGEVPLTPLDEALATTVRWAKQKPAAKS